MVTASWIQIVIIVLVWTPMICVKCFYFVRKCFILILFVTWPVTFQSEMSRFLRATININVDLKQIRNAHWTNLDYLELFSFLGCTTLLHRWYVLYMDKSHMYSHIMALDGHFNEQENRVIFNTPLDIFTSFIAKDCLYMTRPGNLWFTFVICLPKEISASLRSGLPIRPRLQWAVLGTMWRVSFNAVYIVIR